MEQWKNNATATFVYGERTLFVCFCSIRVCVCVCVHIVRCYRWFNKWLNAMIESVCQSIVHVCMFAPQFCLHWFHRSAHREKLHKTLAISNWSYHHFDFLPIPADHLLTISSNPLWSILTCSFFFYLFSVLFLSFVSIFALEIDVI